MKTMLAARAHRGETALRLEHMPVAAPAAGEVLVHVAAAGIAPGMMKLLQMGRFKHLPTIPGHEIAGTVVQVGVGVDLAWQQARVRVHPMLSCGTCAYCLSDRAQMCDSSAMIGHAAFGTGDLSRYAQYHDGGLAEYMIAPVDQLDRLPDNVSFDVGAKIHDLANAVRALKCAALPVSGRLIITAATGTMGTASLKLAPFYGAREIVLVGRSRARLEALRAIAPDLPLDLVALDALGDDWDTSGALTARLRAIFPSGADAVLDYVPEGAVTRQATQALAVGGTLVHMGGSGDVVPIPIREIMIQCWRIVGTRACTRSDTDAVLSLLETGRLHVDDLITHHFSLPQINEALEATQSRVAPIWMAIVHPSSH